MERHAAAQADDVSDRVGILQSLCQHRHDAQLFVEAHEVAEDELRDALRDFVGSDSRIEVVGSALDRHDELAAIALRTRLATAAENSQHPNSNSQSDHARRTDLGTWNLGVGNWNLGVGS